MSEKVMFSNLSELKKIISETPFDKPVASEFLEAIENNIHDIAKQLRDKKKEVEKLNKDMDEMNDLDEDEYLDMNTDKLDCVFETIRYTKPGNLLVTQLIEQFQARLKSHTPAAVLQLLTGRSNNSEEVQDLQTQIDKLKEELYEYESAIPEVVPDAVLDGVLEQIYYVTPGHLVLQQVMEALGEKLKSTSPAAVLQLLK